MHYLSRAVVVKAASADFGQQMVARLTAERAKTRERRTCAIGQYYRDRRRLSPRLKHDDKCRPPFHIAVRPNRRSRARPIQLVDHVRNEPCSRRRFRTYRKALSSATPMSREAVLRPRAGAFAMPAVRLIANVRAAVKLCKASRYLDSVGGSIPAQLVDYCGN